MSDAILIAGLGNPGTKYDKTRHNAGFMAIDALGNALQVKLKSSASLKADLVETRYCDKKIILVKPATFMNNSGEAISAIARKFAVDVTNVWIISDEAALPLGSVRVRRAGSAGGHNGLKSVIEHLKTENFPRFRLGVGPQSTPAPLEDFVLARMNATELKTLKQAINATQQAVLQAVEHGLTETSLG